MAEVSDTNCKQADVRETMATASDVSAWFVRGILLLEACLLKISCRGWRNESDIRDLCQDVYIEIYEFTKVELPKSARGFAFSVARNILVDRIRRAQVVAIEVVADLEGALNRVRQANW